MSPDDAIFALLMVLLSGGVVVMIGWLVNRTNWTAPILDRRIGAGPCVTLCPPPSTHDYGPGHRHWGHDYSFYPQDSSGLVATMMGWGLGIACGDYRLIESRNTPDRRTRYRVTSITYLGDQSDMWRARVSFAPR